MYTVEQLTTVVNMIVNRYNNEFNKRFALPNGKNKVGKICIEDPKGKRFQDNLNGIFHEGAKHFNPKTDLIVYYDFCDDDLSNEEIEIFIKIFYGFFDEINALHLDHPLMTPHDGSGGGLYYGGFALRLA